ncbi:Calcium and integrin-binding family member 2 [Trichoplax sp. H2]|nr:Calcium and integrin-binding family member 2 [Trichoplax sp. H2]|eukprot:RDD37191.1 Calcium and integrin-binding family member 2 [Trichoplax sp. H2]
MGNRQSTFTEEQLEKYQDCTYFTRNEILTAYVKFCELANISGKVALKQDYSKAMKLRIGPDAIKESEALRENPFAMRICQVFSTTERPGYLSFNNYLNMMTVLSDRAPAELKAAYAFRIYDYNDSNYLEDDDLKHALKDLLFGVDELPSKEVNMIVNEIMREADLDDDKKLSYMEFEHAILKSPSFLQNFHVRL